MIRFSSTQKIFEIGKIKIGGQPGELPKVLIGTIFYSGQRLWEDEKLGKFDKNKAQTLISKQDELADETGLPGLLDVVVSSVSAVSKILDFVAKTTDQPFLFDAFYPEVKIAGLKYITECGLTERVIYNSIMHPITADEVRQIRESGVKSAILLAYNVRDRTPQGVVSLLKGSPAQKGLLAVAEEAGIDKPLVDVTLFTYIPTIGVACRAIYKVKDELGLPVGGAPGNATSTWVPSKKWGEKASNALRISAQVVPLAFGADYLMYGPIESAESIFPACAAVDSMISLSAIVDSCVKPLTKDTPLYKVFPDVVEKLAKKVAL